MMIREINPQLWSWGVNIMVIHQISMAIMRAWVLSQLATAAQSTPDFGKDGTPGGSTRQAEAQQTAGCPWQTRQGLTTRPYHYSLR
ncbi:hypothetical protein H4Q26_010814 [Puccinia striiformis f. sp. tritici PST-130]|nr:hypothetical protein H4Q26_010814 [Puccinia striiformis f. sp. tritici PST-130]